MARNSPDSDKKPVKDFSQTGTLTLASDRSHSARILPLRDLENHLQDPHTKEHLDDENTKYQLV